MMLSLESAVVLSIGFHQKEEKKKEKNEKINMNVALLRGLVKKNRFFFCGILKI